MVLSKSTTEPELTSGWPLSSKAIRYITSDSLTRQLSLHPLSQHCYPLGFGYYPQAKLHQMERHQHVDHLLIYCVAGEGKLHTQLSQFTISTGDLVVLPRGLSHQYQSDNNNPWSIYWIHFDGVLSDSYVQHLLPETGNVKLPLGLHPELVASFDTLVSLHQAAYQLSPLIYAANHLAQLLSLVAVIKPQLQAEHFDLQKVLSNMQKNIHGQIKLEQLAANVNLSKYHFCKRFKALTGHSPIQHFIHLKMQRACYLLDLTNQPISAVSQNLGYEDAYYFSRLFKRVIGVPPREYRKLKRG
ncbi:helix-turn-helix transcriptional regulator [Spartinivicinus ruber]|uniref:helix-turn-helix transcriptional regulator n=1 Tax=Spartinivicinus ruber TaxID=2683272 RepID=UPI001E3564F2|nr:AraC family transcriptional regulator [Spartinivicinus ruber]